MFQLAWTAVYRFFFNGMSKLNKGELDQPPPLDVQRRHLQRELENVEAQIQAKRFQEIDSAEL